MIQPGDLQFAPAGDSGLLLRLAPDISAEAFGRVMTALAAVDAGGWPPGWTDVLPGYTCLLVVFDPVVTAHAEVQATLERTLEQAAALPPASGRLVEVPVRYHPEVAPDLEALLAEKSLTLPELIARHTAPVYLCHMLGFRPGFPFLGGLDPLLATPRLATPAPPCRPARSASAVARPASTPPAAPAAGASSAARRCSCSIPPAPTPS